MRIEIWGENKPTLRSFDKEGNYKQWKTAHYGGHAVATTMQEGAEIMQEMFNKGWDVKVEITRG
jgi:hypothetical protein